MTIIFKIMIFLSFLFAFNLPLSAETKRDCSMYSTKTLAGLSDKIRCKKGLAPGKNFLKKFTFKQDDDTKKAKKSCDEHTTKTVAGLIGILKCRKDQK